MAKSLATPTVVIEPRRNILHFDLPSIWRYREMLYYLIWREVKVRYKQTAIGVAWAIIQPLLTMFIFAGIFGRFAKLPSDGVPYTIFAYAALLPWTYFSQAITRTGNSLVLDANLVRKVYFPRLIIPLSSTFAPLVDFSLQLLVLGGLLAWYRVSPSPAMLSLPLFLLLAVLTAAGVGFWLSALNVRYRDVGHTIPFLIQVWMYASPIAYTSRLIPGKWRFLYSLNPMVGVVEGFRFAILGDKSPDYVAMIIGASIVTILLVGGLIFFNGMESTFADEV